ncbi:hypothetical protein D3C72_656830 [compost metagenome]
MPRPFSRTWLLALTLTGCLVAPDAIAWGRRADSPPAPVADRRDDRPHRPRNRRTFVILTGTVTDMLPDDVRPPRHQHFVVRYTGASGRPNRVKVAHNTDLAPRVPVKPNDTVTIKGEFIDETPMDVIHYTHYDPRGGEGGYVKHAGKTYDRLPKRQRRAS